MVAIPYVYVLATLLDVGDKFFAKSQTSVNALKAFNKFCDFEQETL